MAVKPTTTGAAATGFVGVPDDHTSPASMSDWFKPDRQIIGGGGQLIGAIPRAPMYVKGTENAIFDMSAENIARLQGMMSLAGLLTKSSKFRVGTVDGTSDPTYQAFKKILTVANMHGNTWEAALNDLIANPISSAEDREGSQPYTTTSTNTTTTHYDDLDARGLANDAYARQTGRAATAKEAAALKAALNAYAAANPSVSNSTTHHDGQGNSTTSTDSSGGISAAGVSQLQDDAAMAAPDYAEYQAATTYFNALQDMLGPTANVRGR